MNLIKVNLKKLSLIILVVAIIYSFFPLISFWFVTPAETGNNNQSNSEKLGNNDGARFSFIVFGDNRSGFFFNDAASLNLIWHMNREDRFRKSPIDFVLNTGDITFSGKQSHFLAFKKVQRLIKWPLFAVIGNHENKKLFEKFLGKRNFSFSDRNSYFIILDNSEGKLTDRQFEWFEKHLVKGQKYDHIFVAMHKPPFEPYQQSWYGAENTKWAYRFRKLCTDNNVDMVFCGHEHMFKHQKIDGVDYIVTAGGGTLLSIPESDGGYIHYTRIMVNHDYISYEVRKISPPLWEYFSYYFWKEAVYWIRNYFGPGFEALHILANR